ncbi:G-protein beta WD-40 repeat-containing protein [Artemisia annua]|uniref:G-protein beta WD-40 repeat-containing protein n=1 Tax=Artemisia annua TaxID=35608 RepID=A0A2U1LAQ2_ARTAN|nr:G-protein beta WD-40 repeat-containing protein [Artemisia annua]
MKIFEPILTHWHECLNDEDASSQVLITGEQYLISREVWLQLDKVRKKLTMFGMKMAQEKPLKIGFNRSCSSNGLGNDLHIHSRFTELHEDGVDEQTRVKSNYNLPGAVTNRGRPIVRIKCLRIAPTGCSWAAATTEGVLVYSMDENFIFDPIDLDIDVTPETVEAALGQDQPSRILILSLRLNEDALIKRCNVVVPFKYLKILIQAFAANGANTTSAYFFLQIKEKLLKASNGGPAVASAGASKADGMFFSNKAHGCYLAALSTSNDEYLSVTRLKECKDLVRQKYLKDLAMEIWIHVWRSGLHLI